MYQWKSKATWITFLVLLAFVVFLNYKIFAPYLLPIAMGAVLALLMFPLYRRLCRKLSPRLASAVACLVLIGAILVPAGFFTVMAVNQGIAFGQHIAHSTDFSLQGYLHRVMEWKPMQMMFGGPEAVEAQLRSWLQRGGQIASTVILGLAATLPTLVMDLIIAVITCFFLLTDGRSFLGWVSDKIPMDEEVRQRLYGSLKSTSVSVVYAGVAASAVQAVTMFLAFLALGIPAAFLAGGATFVLAWIPVLGCGPVWIAGAIYLYVQGSLIKVAGMVALGLFTGVIDNVVRSWVLGGRGEMHPLVSLVAIIGGVQVFGLVGVFFGPILASVLISLLQVVPVIAGRFGIADRKEVVPVGPDALRA